MLKIADLGLKERTKVKQRNYKFPVFTFVVVLKIHTNCTFLLHAWLVQ